MSIVSCNLVKDRRATINEKNIRSKNRNYIVISDDYFEDEENILTAPGIAIGDAIGGADTDSVCNSIEANCTSDDGLTWLVSVQYGEIAGSENPLDDPTEYSLSFAQFEIRLDKDIKGKAIVNSALDPFLETIVKDDSRPILSVKKNIQNFDFQLAYKYRDGINKDVFLGCPRGTVKVSNIQATSQNHDEFGTYWAVSYEFHINLQGWQTEILDCGFRELDANGKKKHIEIKGAKATEPVPLDRNGKKLPDDAQPKFKKFDVYPELNFEVFND